MLKGFIAPRSPLGAAAVLRSLKVERGYRFSFSYSVTDIEILADLTA
jgi:hypothetical protein